MARLLVVKLFTLSSLSTFHFLLLFLVLTPSLEAVPTQAFQPLKDTLRDYNIQKIPEASEYPDVPAIAVLSLQEYKQNGSRHTRRYHKIIKILTSDGKEYTNLQIPCFSSCHVEARTIKADGRILNLPAKDLFRNQNLSGYKSPYFMAQFAMPGVEAGDLIEYVASVEYPIPFFLEDFRFSERYPLLKGIFLLTHPIEDSYVYTRYSSAAGPGVQVQQTRVTEGPASMIRTTFVVENVRPYSREKFSPEARQDLPGIRLILESRTGRRMDIFKDWIRYGDFLSSKIAITPVLDHELIRFAQTATGSRTDVQEIIKAIYSAAEKQIQITEENLWLNGFEFRSPKDVLKSKVAAPQDFALFLAACFRSKKWTSHLVLVNSHDQTEANKEAVFPPDLDLLFLNVKTPIGEFLLDCNRNGIPPLYLTSKGMNRFALGIPLFVAKTKFTGSGCYTSRTTYRAGNSNHMDMTATASGQLWNLEFRWKLAGEFQAEWIRLHRQKGEPAMRMKLIQVLRSSLEAHDLRDLQFVFTDSALEIRGKASRTRKQLDQKTEILVNEIWNSGFDLRPFILENRFNRLLLPVAGDISSTFRVRSPLTDATLPSPVHLDCQPIKYAISFHKLEKEIVIEEKLSISDLEMKQPSFAKFSDFLNQYYEKHFWAILLKTL